MMFSKEQRQKVRKIHKKWMMALDCEGKLMAYQRHAEAVEYDAMSIRKMLIQEIEQLGFKVEVVKPIFANCIIRVYHDTKKYEHENYHMSGGMCYMLNSMGEWVTECNGMEHEIDFAKMEKRVWFYQDEYWDVSLDFFDTYVRLVKA